MTLYNDAAPQVRACQAKFTTWLQALRRSKLAAPILREMARAKLGGFLGYSLPHLDISDAQLTKWQQGLDAVMRDKERLTAFASTRQVSAPTQDEGLGGLDLFALRDSGTVAVIYGGLNATSRLGDQPSLLTLQPLCGPTWTPTARLIGCTSCPLRHPTAAPYVPASRDPMKRACTWTRMAKALCATGTFLHDRTEAFRPGRSRDLPLEAVASILASLPRPAGRPQVDFVAEFAHLRGHLATKGL
jgi:hypothetical protein